MALAFDVAMSGTVAFGVNTIASPASTTIAATANRAAVIFVYHSSNTATGITSACSGVAGTAIASTDTSTARTPRVFAHGVIAPASGASKNASCSWTGNRDAYLGCLVYNGADQTTPFSGGVTANGATGAPSVTPTGSASGDLSAACVASGSVGGATQTSAVGPLTGTSEDFEATRGANGVAHAWNDSFSPFVAAGVTVKQVSASGSSGTLAKTNANDTLAGSGTTTVLGSLAKTNANDTSAVSGTTTILGTLARTSANDSVVASGTTTVTGTLAKTNANDTSVASGAVGSAISGTLAYTNANDTLASSGTTTVTGLLARTNANDTATASGVAGSVSGTVSVTNANDSLSAFGAAASPSNLDVFFGGGFFPKRRRRIEPEEAIEIIEAVGTEPQRDHAARIETERLFERLAERDLTQSQARLARAERAWAMHTAQRILRDRDDEEIVMAVLLMD